MICRSGCRSRLDQPLPSAILGANRHPSRAGRPKHPAAPPFDVPAPSRDPFPDPIIPGVQDRLIWP